MAVVVMRVQRVAVSQTLRVLIGSRVSRRASYRQAPAANEPMYRTFDNLPSIFFFLVLLSSYILQVPPHSLGKYSPFGVFWEVPSYLQEYPCSLWARFVQHCM